MMKQMVDDLDLSSGVLRADRPPTLWGVTPDQLHNLYWRSQGLEVVRVGQSTPIRGDRFGYLLLDDRHCVVFAIERLPRNRRRVVRVVVSADKAEDCRDLLVRKDEWVGFERIYPAQRLRKVLVVVTGNRGLAETWRTSGSAETGMQRLASQGRVATHAIDGGFAVDRSRPHWESDLVKRLVDDWESPDEAFEGLSHNSSGLVWGPSGFDVPPSARIFGRAWIGVGRRVVEGARLIGPAILWDDPRKPSPPVLIRSGEIERVGKRRPLFGGSISVPVSRAKTSGVRTSAKRVFDIAFAVAALVVTLPLFPLIMLAIYLEDGRPFFFSQRRETCGGREFHVLKFRTMCRGAERMRSSLEDEDIADGPQLFVPRDPRLTKVGLILRALQIDEWPQFFHVLRGDMSIVGPRPLAFEENQWCPAWREVRLSVRPGITGLWQVMRTRRSGLDFLEWIKYDIEYVEHQSLWLDLRIIWATVALVLRGPLHRDSLRLAGTEPAASTSKESWEEPMEAAAAHGGARTGPAVR